MSTLLAGLGEQRVPHLDRRRRRPGSSPPIPCRKRFIAHRRAVLSTISMPAEGVVAQVLASGRGRGRSARRCSRGRRAGSRRCRRPGRRSSRPGCGCMHVDHRPDQRPRREVLAGAGLRVGGVLLQQALVGVALDVGVDAASRSRASIRSTISRLQLRRVLDPVLGLAEDQAEQPGLACPARCSSDGVVSLQLGAVLLEQRRPVVAGRDPRRLVQRRLRPLVRHLQEQQVGQLLDVVAVREPVVAQDGCSSSRASGRGAATGRLIGCFMS